MHHRDDNGGHPVELSETSYQVGALVAVEDGSEHVDAVGRQAVPLVEEERVDAGRSPAGVAVDVGPRGVEGRRFEDLADHGRGVSHPGGRGEQLGSALAPRDGGGAEPPEFDVVVDANGGEYPAGHRVEECLGQTEIAAVGDPFLVVAASGPPDSPPVGHAVDQRADPVHSGHHGGPVHEESPVGVVAAGAPVSIREVRAGPTRHLPEAGDVVDEAGQDGVGDLATDPIVVPLGVLVVAHAGGSSPCARRSSRKACQVGSASGRVPQPSWLDGQFAGGRPTGLAPTSAP